MVVLYSLLVLAGADPVRQQAVKCAVFIKQAMRPAFALPLPVLLQVNDNNCKAAARSLRPVFLCRVQIAGHFHDCSTGSMSQAVRCESFAVISSLLHCPFQHL